MDDNTGLSPFFSKKYKWVVYVYGSTEEGRKDINVIPCENWQTVAKKVKECKL